MARADDRLGQPKLIIISGGPCAGKTSVLKELQKRNYFIVPEVATAIILEEYERLDRLYPQFAPHHKITQIEDLQYKILKAQLSTCQKAVSKTSKNPPKKNLIIFDRSEVDTLVYASALLQQETSASKDLSFFYEKANQTLKLYNPNVIFCEVIPVDHYNITSNMVRYETYEQSISMGKKLREAYLNFGFTLHEIGYKKTIIEKANEVERLLHSFK
ncbi:hypothetical protein BN1013_00104 [Candidatus Rubidus massiliensis]|nr:hypothetical protein BN1013_00104 [Candidatus Rubidus massiliensis]